MRHMTGDFRCALVALDGSARAERVVPWLRRLVVPGSEIHLLTVLPPAQAVVTEGGTVYADQVESAGRLAVLAALGFLAARLTADGVRSTGHVRFGEPVQAILDTVRETDVEVIAVTAGERRPWWRWLSAGVVERVLRRSPVPVLVARGRGQRGA